MSHRKLFQLPLLLFVLAVSASGAAAQQIQLTSPLQAQTFPEGEDYASQVLRNPWDMNERRDVGYEEFFVGPSIQANGIWSAVNAVTGAYLFPLFGGFKGALHAEAPPGERDLPRYGTTHPIDTGKYRVLSYRLRNSARSMFAIYWSSRDGATYFPDGAEVGASFDGYRLDRAYLHSDFQIYTFTMPTSNFENRGGNWTGAVHALRIDPSTGAPPGASTELDWMRLVDPSSAPRLRIEWRELGIPAGALITVWAQGGGFGATPLARYVSDGQGRFLPAGTDYSTSPILPSSNGLHELSTALLPPGTYQFFVTASRASGGAVVELARSAASAPITIDGAPIMDFTSPSPVSGVDYAQEALGNPWDMSDFTDVANLPSSLMPQLLRQYVSPAFANGWFQAVSEGPYPGNGQGDPQVLLPIAPNRPVDTARFRYLSYRMAADESLFPTIHQKISEGWVARPVFWNNDFFAEGASTFGHPVFEGWHTYTVDLWQTSILERGVPWKSLPFIRHLRLDPLETSVPTWFFLDDVKLTAENIPLNNQFTMEYVLTDFENNPADVTFYLDTDDSGFNGAQIGHAAGMYPGKHSFSYNTSVLGAGRYYPFAVVRDARNARGVYATAPIVVGGPTAIPLKIKIPFDYDGDERSDPVVFRRGRRSGRFYANPSTRETYAKDLGAKNASAVHGDFDGDKIADLTAVHLSKNVLWWSSQLSARGVAESRIWGVAGDEPVPADYNGDGEDDLAIYRSGIWYVLYRNGTSAVAAWGVPGDIPVPADYDGDGKADLAIFRPTDGSWWVLLTGFGSGISSVGHRAEQWGLAGDIPVPGDFDGDGRHDFAVFRSWNGTWYLRSSATGAVNVHQWGLPGDMPIVGDFTGDGKLDLTVFRPTTGQWFINDRQNSTATAQWGLPGDLPPQ